jgi:2-polyprenyl-3-methyl-5-hydroxy-6-metoxy-1,4-benzoquinol methylase
VAGIADFRLAPDPYISIEDDRIKGLRLLDAARTRSFAELVDYYYSITPEVPGNMARQWTAHTLALPAIAEHVLKQAGLTYAAAGTPTILDVGCGTAGLLQAAAFSFSRLVGVDVAFRWLIIARQRLRESGIEADLVCANAEALPFGAGIFDAITATDVIEHVRDAAATIGESARVARPGAKIVVTTNNRYAPLPDPQVGLWALGFCPRRWQPAYVGSRIKGIHVYRVQMKSARELNRLFRMNAYRKFQTRPATLAAPHIRSRPVQTAVRMYNALQTLPLIRESMTLFGPRLITIAER